MQNSAIDTIFDDIAAKLELKKDNIFKIRAYRRAARAIAALTEPVAKLVAENRVQEIGKELTGESGTINRE